MSVNGDVLGTMKTTEVTVTSEAIDGPSSIRLQNISGRQSLTRAANPRNNDAFNGAYSVHISSGPGYPDERHHDDVDLPIQGRTLPTTPNSATVSIPQPRRAPNPRRRNHDLNNAAWSYTKCSILFFTALLITWLPSSANRVYSVVHTKDTCAPLELMSAFVLPLQGFWNAAIYAVTSWSACKSLWMDMKLGRRPDVTELVGGMRPQTGVKEPRSKHKKSTFSTQLRSPKMFDSESMTELANSRGTSADGSHQC